jgi:hypothetical protein
MFACEPECGWTFARSAPEERPRALDGERLDLVDELAAAVVALPGIALGVLVGENGALRLEDRLAHDVLGGDQLEVVLLALDLATDRREDRRVGPLERRAHRRALRSGHIPTSGSTSAILSTRR